jgi:predicted enzyme related to lactoylglutathione lyase
MLKIKRSAAAIPAQDVKRAREFYEQKVGLTPAEVLVDGGAVYRAGEGEFLVFPSMGRASGDHTQLSLVVEDVVEAAEELKGRGITFEDYEYPEFRTRDGVLELPDGSRTAWFKDTEGNLIALTQRVPARTGA